MTDDDLFALLLQVTEALDMLAIHVELMAYVLNEPSMLSLTRNSNETNAMEGD